MFGEKKWVMIWSCSKLIDDHTLVALTNMIVESRAEEKEVMVDLIMNCITQDQEYN